MSSRAAKAVPVPAQLAPLPLTRDHSILSLLRRRWQGVHDVDAWGLDPDLVALAEPLASLRWKLVVKGAEHLPAIGPVVLVCSRRFGVTEPFVVAAAVRREAGRQVRTIGAPDLDPIGPLLQRFGAVLARPDEVAGLLANGEVVQVPLAPEPLRRDRAGTAPLELLAPAVAAHATVLPVAVVGREVGRRWKIVIGAPVPAPNARGPLAVAELADLARRGVQDLLDAEVSGLLPFL